MIDIFRKYTWVVPSKDKAGVTTVIAFQKMLDDSMKLYSKSKPN